MPAMKYYMAGSVPRFLRQMRAGYLPLNCLIGSRLMKGENGNDLVMDIIMLPPPDFRRMRANVGLQHIFAPTPQPDGAGFMPTYVMTDVKTVAVPPDEPDPEAYARDYFMVEFGFIAPPVPAAESPKQPPFFAGAADECTSKTDPG